MSDATTSTTISVGGVTPRPIAFADFFDGDRAMVRRVEFELEDTSKVLEIRPPETQPIRWSYSSLRRLPDQADPDALVLTSTNTPLARLILSDNASILMLEARVKSIDTRQPVRGKGRIAAWATAAIASVALIILVLIPIMADQLARFLPPEGEQALGQSTLEQIQSALADGVAELDTCDNPEGLAAMEAMQARLGTDYDLPYDITVTILDHPMVNAFALPGGQVVFFRGMLEAATHPDQIAAVLAHEIGHVVARDPTRIALRSAGSLGVLGLLFGDFAGGAAVLFLVEQLIRADYTQDAEAAADDFGITMMRNAGADPAALADLFQIVLEEYGDVTGIAAHFVSHPSLGDRIAKAQAAGDNLVATAPTLTDAEWTALQNVCSNR